MNKKKIYLLIGPKGSGKTFIGSLFDKHFNIKFIRVEDWAKEIKKERHITNDDYIKEVFQIIENGIKNALNINSRIVFESTGLTNSFDTMLANLRKDFQVVTIRLEVNTLLCLERVKTRDTFAHINVSDDQVNMINEMVLKRDLSTDFRINNENKSEQELVEELKAIIQK
ncbi:MAG: hypothetical protein K0S32_2316 [Bacteroidetes bacterium]|jgi:predicted kinase|nr:hypothetical protein [Bacteroidota bacterium]